MAEKMDVSLYEDLYPVPVRAVRFPLELRPPPGFRPESPETWPRLPGRLEYVGGRLLLMPPCGGAQSTITVPLTSVLDAWNEEHPEFIVGNNEAGMLLGGEVRGADAAIWRRQEQGLLTSGYRRVPPVLAAEVSGQDEGETELRAKARWYFDHGVRVVWLILQESREVLVLRPDSEHRFARGDEIPESDELPGLRLEVDRLFRRLDP